MSPPPVARTPHERWKDTVDRGRDDPRWKGHDELIRGTVTDFNARLSRWPGYRPLDPSLVKAMVWVESGGPDNAAWTTRPMQIGNPGDPGLAALLGGREGGDLILSEAQKALLRAGANGPGPNIVAGTAYLLMRAASYAHRSVPDPLDTQGREVKVMAGDHLERIAKTWGSTVEMLKSLNPGAAVMIKPGQMLKVRKAAIRQVITGWSVIDPAFAAKRYNVGDPEYQRKLEHCLTLLAR